MTGYTRYFNKMANPTFGFDSSLDTKQSFTNSASTLMQKTFPKKSYTVDNISAGNLKKDSNKAGVGLDQAKQSTGALKDDVKAVKEDLKQDFQNMQKEVLDTFKDVAQDNGFDPNAAVNTIAPDQSMTDIAAVFDGVTMGSMGGVAASIVSAVADITGETKKLKPGEINALVEETHRRLQHSQKENQSLVAFGGEVKKTSGADYSNTKPEDIKKILESKPDDLPEMKSLNSIEFSLNDAENNQGLNDVKAGVISDGNKIEAALERGDVATLTALEGGNEQKAQAIMHKPEAAKEEIETPEPISSAEVFSFADNLIEIKGVKVDKKSVEESFDDEEAKKKVAAVFAIAPPQVAVRQALDFGKPALG